VPTGVSYVVGDVTVRPDEGRAFKDDVELALTKTEFQLLCHLAGNQNRVWTRDQLLEQVWGYTYSGDGRLVDTHIARLRAKIENDPALPRLIQTVRGIGYRMTSGGT
jgi:DNA-binding response OmpR family regulator